MTLKHLRAEQASVSAFVAVVAIALVMVAGMAYDGGQILAAHASARDLATNAARAGAQQVDLDTLRATGRADLAPDLAVKAVERYLSDVGTEADGAARVSGDRITVSVTLRQPMRILPLPDRTVVATEAAVAVTSETTTSSEDATSS